MPEATVTNSLATPDAIREEMRVWRQAHPHATWVEIERTLDRLISRWRADVLAEAVAASPLRDFQHAEERPRCPSCDVPLHAVGPRTRSVTTNDGEQVLVERTYGRCPRCRAGFFPPGRGVGVGLGEFESHPARGAGTPGER